MSEADLEARIALRTKEIADLNVINHKISLNVKRMKDQNESLQTQITNFDTLQKQLAEVE